MKRFLFHVFCLFTMCLLCIPCQAAEQPEKKGQLVAIESDIRVYIDGTEIRSYNMDGTTYIDTSAIKSFGFNGFDGANRRSILERVQPPYPNFNFYKDFHFSEPKIEKSIGAVIGVAEDYTTEIVFEGNIYEGYTVNGNILFPVRILEQVGTVYWDAEKRAVYVNVEQLPAETEDTSHDDDYLEDIGMTVGELKDFAVKNTAVNPEHIIDRTVEKRTDLEGKEYYSVGIDCYNYGYYGMGYQYYIE